LTEFIPRADDVATDIRHLEVTPENLYAVLLAVEQMSQHADVPESVRDKLLDAVALMDPPPVMRDPDYRDDWDVVAHKERA